MSGQFDIFPAIDLRHGSVVRLSQGADDARTEYGLDPVETALGFEAAGATWLHVVDLDSAFGDGSSRHVIKRIVDAVGMKVQVGGGVRTDADVAELLEAGVTRVIIGSAAVENPDWVGQVVVTHGADRVVVGIDAKDGDVKTRGWVESTSRSAADVAKEMADRGVREVVYTNIANDGMLTGPDTAGSIALASEAGVRIIVSGGVGALEHLTHAFEQRGDALSGIIVGKALYEERFTLAEALEVCRA